ncbi:hypothetical protein HCN44_007283 [Aphidius gifuensis]|uniref:Sorting nexin-29 n=1 Tax=Aphidius gifuensis TaxID=684658 RepID=A0A834XMD7_APHGI|nr:sorting nexin-29 isoform X2 [Aphidius gifuensis]KAF7988973.1 hypothetical protein HCN44_007283 [Aphidius gifuensis]
MALRMMTAIAPGQLDPVNEIDHAAEREKLQANLLAASKLCHVRFGGKMELATESDQCVSRLCHAFEMIFRHGYRNKTNEKLNSTIRQVSELVSGGISRNLTDNSFWSCIKTQLTWHEQERFTVLRNIRTDYGRGRAWLRAALNERSLERHLHAILNPSVLSLYYDEYAFILDQERTSVLPNIAAGLGTIVFAIRIDNDELDKRSGFDDTTMAYRASQSEPIINSVIKDNNTQRPRRKIPTNIISFDNDDDNDNDNNNDGGERSVSTSAPATCFNSPTDLTVKKLNDKTEKTNVPLVLNVKNNWIQKNDILEEDKVLTPLNDNSGMVNLMPVSPLDQTLDDMLVALPTYINDNDITENAIEATEPLTGIDYHIDADKLDIDALKIRLLAMNEVLEQAREDSISSRLQLARFQRQHQNYLERHEVQLQALNRENELLRQQLRKYVTAVQLLKRESDITTNVNDEEQQIDEDYNIETQQYQEKLVQVAEMHAELMEFNSRLTMQLSSRDKLVKRLQAELECLRGPLNENDIPIDSQYLIHIWIPSAFLTGQSTDVHHVYQIYVRIRNSEWNLYRRYAQFYSLYKDLKKHDSVVTTFEFPPKKTIGNKDAKFVEERRQKLQQWLRRVVGRLAQCSPAFTLRPSKQTLISLMPFFGDYPSEEESKKNNTGRNNISSSPQYMGL